MVVNVIKDLPATLAGVRFTFEFEQSGRSFGALGRVNPDLFGFAFRRGVPVDYVEPDSRTDRLNGALRHTSGNARGAGAEIIEVSPALLDARNADIDGFAVAVLCRSTFKKIPGATCRVDDISAGAAQFLHVMRFDIRSDATAFVLGGIRRGMSGAWELIELGRSGQVLFWSEVANLVTNDMRVNSSR